MRKAVGYIRVSTTAQSQQGISLSNQEQKIRAQADVSDYELAAIIRDEGVSAKDLNRPGVQRLLAMVKAKEIEAVIIYSLSRLTRNVGDLNKLVKLCNRRDVAVISVKDSIGTKTAGGRMVLNVLASIAQWEREAIGERTAEVLKHKRAQGEKTGGDVPFGYRIKAHRKKEQKINGEVVTVKVPLLEKEPVEQKAIGLMKKLRSKSLSYRAIARELGTRGFRTRRGKKEWSHKIVRGVLARAA